MNALACAEVVVFAPRATASSEHNFDIYKQSCEKGMYISICHGASRLYSRERAKVSQANANSTLVADPPPIHSASSLSSCQR